jgi:hypothetical protein
MIETTDNKYDTILKFKSEIINKTNILDKDYSIKDSDSTIDSQIENFQKNNSETLSLLNTNTIFFEKSENEKIILNIPKNVNKIRLNYYTKLIKNDIWKKRNIKNSYNSLIIFDWDDTLFCTSQIAKNNCLNQNQISKIQKNKILKLENEVKKILQNSINKAETYIITNSEPGWVEYSCKQFFPSLIDLLSQITIISARGLYENKFPNDSYMWKINTFNDIVDLYDQNLLSNIMCIGDSFLDINAGKNLSNQFKNAFIKTIKFKEAPTIDELIMEIKLVNEKFIYIYSAVKNWTINVKRKI